MSQVALVTGDNGRIGAAACERLRRDGFRVVGVDVGADCVGDWPHYACDLTDLGAMAATFARIEAEHGLVRVLFNNAGIYRPSNSFLEVPPEQFDAVLGINLRTAYFAMQWVAQRLVAEGESGSIVSTASMAGQFGSSAVEYGASKAAVINMTKSVGKQLGRHGIRVNAIAPGLIDTAMGALVPQQSRQRALDCALGRVGQAEEIASVVSFLAGPDSSYVTCATIDVNGGV